METVSLTPRQSEFAADIQHAMDTMGAAGGGTIILAAGVITLDRALHLRSGIHLRGHQDGTLLRKLPARCYPMDGYHNYGMCDVPLRTTAGLKPGMTVSVLDDLRRGFYSTFATIRWVDEKWVGLDRGLQADLLADAAPVLTTAHPLICGHRITGATVSQLTLEGSRNEDGATMDACRGAAVYLYESRDCTFRQLREKNFGGEGLGYQMCRDIRVIDCHFHQNTGNGFHPGAGSTNTLFENCTADGNAGAGFFFCVRANHITVRDCSFAGNDLGMSIGTRDCHNLIERCQFNANHGPGVLARACPEPSQVSDIHLYRSQFRNNGKSGRMAGAQLRLQAAASRLRIEGCSFTGEHGILIDPGVQQVLIGQLSCSEALVHAPADALVTELRLDPVGYRDKAAPELYRHLITA